MYCTLYRQKTNGCAVILATQSSPQVLYVIGDDLPANAVTLGMWMDGTPVYVAAAPPLTQLGNYYIGYYRPGMGVVRIKIQGTL